MKNKNHPTKPYNKARRADRTITDEEWIKSYLHRAAFGIMATTYEGQPFINSNTFVYDEEAHAIYLHTAQSGRTLTNIKANERVCFSVAEMGRLLPADTAINFSVEYSSVIVFGTAIIINDEAEAKRALQMLLDKYFPHLHPNKDYRAITVEELQQTAVYRIDIEQWSGKQKKADDNLPGAFLYSV